ncbi:MAG: RecQ family ATP-dependent DNA helicase, partial [Solirubrobacterales bacterium]
MNEAQLTEALRSQFGHAGFRPGQLEAVEAVVSSRDVLLVMPTGAGKSLGYQLPAILDRKLAVVVSPLVSLMTDQVESLGERAELINAQRDGADNRRALERAVAGEVAMLYVAPERFATPGFIDRLREAAIGIFVVDEAHCVSQWGHDFRPDYLRLGEVARALGARSIFAATATATPRVAADVAQRLGLRDPVRITTGFDRPNLSYDVVKVPSERAKQQATLALLSEPDALPAIVYAGTRKK